MEFVGFSAPIFTLGNDEGLTLQLLMFLASKSAVIDCNGYEHEILRIQSVMNEWHSHHGTYFGLIFYLVI